MLSPMMQHYFQMKEKYKDSIIFYRLGDFYEMFFEDAVEMSKALELTLTGRDCGLEERAPMCGIPVKSLDIYLNKAVELGYRVAICEQLTEPKAGQMVERDIVRVVTPGTIMEGATVEEKTNNYIASCYQQNNKAGISWIDITTGEFKCIEIDSVNLEESVNDILTMIKPKEVIAVPEFKNLYEKTQSYKLGVLPKLTSYYSWAFDYDKAHTNLLKQLNVATLKAFECDKLKLVISSAGALVEYLRETQKRSLSHINSIKPIKIKSFMYLDYQTRKNLEITQNIRDGAKKGSLLWLLDSTQTSMGGRLLRQFVEQPLQKKSEIDYRLNGVEELRKNIIKRDSLIDELKNVYDIERICGKISYGSVNPKDCLDLSNSLARLPKIKEIISSFNSNILKDISNNIVPLDDAVDMLSKAIREDASSIMKDGGFIKEGFSAKLDELKELSQNSVQLLNNLEQQEKDATGIKNLKIGYNRVFGYFIEVTNSQKELVPFRFQRKQTLSNCERFITQELKDLEERILSASEQALKLEQELFAEIREYLLSRVKEMQNISYYLALLDAILSFAIVSSKNNYTKPQIVSNDGELSIINGRHPIVEKYTKDQFVANDTKLNNSDVRTMIITGPNMAGKSTYMRQVAIIVLMAHMGCFVPATSAQIPLTDRIFTRIGASDDLAFGQSTFMVEMVEVANILHNATNDSLIILDEVGRGTATFDGLSIAQSVVEYISQNLKAKTLFSTHYHELTDLEGVLDGVKNFRISVKEFNGSIIFLRKIVRGGANKSFGIEVASLAGLPKGVVDRAKELLDNLEKIDLQKNNLLNGVVTQQSTQVKSNAHEIVNMISELDINKLSPIESLIVLTELQEKINKK